MHGTGHVVRSSRHARPRPLRRPLLRTRRRRSRSTSCLRWATIMPTAWTLKMGVVWSLPQACAELFADAADSVSSVRRSSISSPIKSLPASYLELLVLLHANVTLQAETPVVRALQDSRSPNLVACSSRSRVSGPWTTPSFRF